MPGMSRLYTLVARHFSIGKAEAEKLIGEGRVKVNGNCLPPSAKLEYWDEITCDGKVIRAAKTFVYIKYHKPPGIESTTGEDIPGNLRSAVSHPAAWQPVGRLDKASEGLMLLTDDGRIMRAIAESRSEKEKEYEVRLDRAYDDVFLESMRQGVSIMGKVTRPAQLIPDASDPCAFRIVLTQGLNRQIRRMCYKLGYQVVFLRRIRIAGLGLGDLLPGEWRLLTKEEQDALFAVAGITA